LKNQFEETHSKVTKVEQEVSLAESKAKHLTDQIENLNKELEEAKSHSKPVIEVPPIVKKKEETLLAKWGELLKEEKKDENNEDNKEENQEKKGEEDEKKVGQEIAQVQEEY